MAKRKSTPPRDRAERLAATYSRLLVEYLRLLARERELQLASRMHCDNDLASYHRDAAIVRRRAQLLAKHARTVWRLLLQLHGADGSVKPPF